MKNRILLFLGIILCTCVRAQTIPNEVESLEQARQRHERTAMLALGGWAVGNIGLGLALRSATTGETRRFHEMNAIWNTVNLGIAGFSLLSAMGGDGEALTAFESLRENGKFQKILLFNAGLDLAYVAGGAYLIERSRRPDADRDRLRGYGKSVILQGGFLFAFDLVNYFVAAGRTDDYAPLLGATADGLGLTLCF